MTLVLVYQIITFCIILIAWAQINNRLDKLEASIKLLLEL